MQTIVAVVLLSLTVAFARADDAWHPYGTFVGNLDLRMGGDGKTAVLLAPFAYIDAAGKHWETPTGWKVDGASIPWPLWSIIGSPWTGKYREASVIHDYYCDTHKEPWADVHRTFYTAMLANGVDDLQAKIMYVAVYRFGPRWKFEYTPKCQNCLAVPYAVDAFTPEFNQDEFDALKSKLEAGEPVDQVRAEADASVQHELEKQEVGSPILFQK